MNGDQFLFGLGNVTGGANGILNVDPLDFFGKEIAVQHDGVFAVGYYFVALGVLRGRVRRCCGSSTTRARAARGGRSARTRSPPR